MTWVQVLEVYISSKTWYFAQVLPFPAAEATSLCRILGDFVWAQSLATLTFSQLHPPFSQGGLGISSLVKRAKSLQIKQVFHQKGTSQPRGRRSSSCEPTRRTSLLRGMSSCSDPRGPASPEGGAAAAASQKGRGPASQRGGRAAGSQGGRASRGAVAAAASQGGRASQGAAAAAASQWGPASRVGGVAAASRQGGLATRVGGAAAASRQGGLAT